MLNYPIGIPEKLHSTLSQLLQTGCVDFNGGTADFSGLQEVTLRAGVLRFNPPVKVRVKVGPIMVKTTISSVKNVGGGLKVEIDNSPIDVLLKAED